MFLAVQELEQRPVRFDQSYAPGVVDLMDEDLRQASPLEIQGTAEYDPALEEIRIRGRLRTELESDCDRCLEVVRYPLELEFRLAYRARDAFDALPEKHLSGEEAEIGFFTGDGLELMDVLREQVLLALPMRRLCRPDCQGLCPVCGQNRNEQRCDCAVQPVDDRWSALRNLKS